MFVSAFAHLIAEICCVVVSNSICLRPLLLNLLCYYALSVCVALSILGISTKHPALGEFLTPFFILF